jgi:hypothetical protein
VGKSKRVEGQESLHTEWVAARLLNFVYSKDLKTFSFALFKLIFL